MIVAAAADKVVRIVARCVDEIMNRELFSVRAEDRVGSLLQHLTTLGITGAPVLDGDGRAIGFVSMRDVLQVDGSDEVLRHMTAPADTVPASATIEEAADRVCETGRHHLVCVDGNERAVGFVSAVDVLRGMMGRPVPHPEAFPHFDFDMRLAWSDDTPLDTDHIRDVPGDPGLFVLVHAPKGRPNRVVWSEAVDDLRARLTELLDGPATPLRHLAIMGERIDLDDLWFRTAVAPSARAIVA